MTDLRTIPNTASSNSSAITLVDGTDENSNVSNIFVKGKHSN